MYFPQIFANAGNSRNIDQTWKRKEPRRGLVLPHEYPRGAVFQPQRFWSKKIKNEKDEKTRRFFARFRCSKIISQSNNQLFKAAKRVTDDINILRNFLREHCLKSNLLQLSHNKFCKNVARLAVARERNYV